MAKIKYKRVSQELLQMASPNGNDVNVRSSINSSIDVVEHYRIDIDKLIPYHKQARKTFNKGDIEGLAESIREHGIRQPLTVIPSINEQGKYEVVSGERRLRAANLARITKLPCIIISDQLLAEEIALAENIQREDLHPLELGEALTNILNSRKDLNQRSLAEKLGVSEKVISQNIQYTKLPEEVKQIILARNIRGRDFLRKLVKSDKPMNFFDSEKSEKFTQTRSVSSVLRISLENEQLKVQSNGIERLNVNQRNQLRSILSELESNLLK